MKDILKYTPKNFRMVIQGTKRKQSSGMMQLTGNKIEAIGLFIKDMHSLEAV